MDRNTDVIKLILKPNIYILFILYALRKAFDIHFWTLYRKWLTSPSRSRVNIQRCFVFFFFLFMKKKTVDVDLAIYLIYILIHICIYIYKM